MESNINRIWVKSNNTLESHKNLEVRQISAWIILERKANIVSKDGIKWTIPGGHPEAGESLEMSLNREVFEESGIDISNVSRELIGYHIIQKLDGEKVVSEYLQLRYLVQLTADQINIEELKPVTNDEVKFTKFIEIEKIPEFVEWAGEAEEYGVVRECC